MTLDIRPDDIQPLTEHRAHLAAHFKRIEATGRPLFVTSNGKTAAVVLSPAAYDKLLDAAQLASDLAMLQRSVEDVKNNRIKDARKATRALARRHGIKV
jgi:prevent-host-death family protein